MAVDVTGEQNADLQYDWVSDLTQGDSLYSTQRSKYVDNYGYKNSNDRHVQSNWEEVEHLAVISDGPYPQEADEQKFKGQPSLRSVTKRQSPSHAQC